MGYNKYMIRMIRYWYKYYKTKIFKWHLRRTKSLSIKGLYACYYIIDKYLCCTNPEDYNEEYEKPIVLTLIRLRQMDLFKKLGIEENLTDAAFFTVGNFLVIASDEMREQIYTHLGNWPFIDRLKLYVKSGVLV